MKIYIVTIKGAGFMFNGVRVFSSLEKADKYTSKLDKNITYDIISTVIDQYED